MVRTLSRSGPLLCAIAVVLGTGASLPAQGPDRGIVMAPVGRAGERVALYSGSYALVVGVNQYDAKAVWGSLDSIPRELAEVEAALRETGFSVIVPLRNPTGDQLRTAVADFIQRYGYDRNARLVFFFAGHGYSLDNGDKGYFLPRDTPDPKVDEPGFRRTALYMQQVATWAQDLTAKHALFVFDSCFSGSIFRTRSNHVPEQISQMTASPVREFIAAGSAFETVPARSVFTPVFVRGLKGAADYNRDGYVTGTELGNYVQGEVISYRTGQTPQFGKIRDPQLDQGDLVFAVPAPPPVAAGIDPALALQQGIQLYNAKDYAGAYPLLQRAASGGQTRAAFYLGYLFDQGLGVMQDFVQAREWYQRSAAAGDTSAMNNLGVMYAIGRGVPRDDAAAIAWYRKSAAGGHLMAISNLADRYERGAGVAADSAIALTLYKRAAFRGHEPALKALQRLGEQSAVQWATADTAEALKIGLDRFRQGQRAESFDPLLRATAGNSSEAEFYVGYLYSNGIGTPADPEEARVLYERSVAAGNIVAMNNLGVLYETGRGVPQDYAAARALYLKSADRGYGLAMYNLANLYEYGRGVPKSIETALDWHRKAAALKIDEAIKAVQRLEQAGPPPATRGGPPPPVTPTATGSGTASTAAVTATTIEFDSFWAVGVGGTRFGSQAVLTINLGGLQFREQRPPAGKVATSFSVSCGFVLGVKTETEDDGRIALRLELKDETFKLYSAANARRAVPMILDACKSR